MFILTNLDLYLMDKTLVINIAVFSKTELVGWNTIMEIRKDIKS